MASKSRKRSNSKRTKKTVRKSGESFVLDEIIIWVTLAVSVLLLISNFGFGGSVGDAVSSLLMEAFGAGVYLFPFLLFGLTAFTISNKQNISAYVKTAAAAVLFVLICSMFEMILRAGGSLGESLTAVMTPALGVIGTYVVLVICMIICMVVITGKSVLKGMKKQSGRAYNKAREETARRREASRERQELRKKETAAREPKEPKHVRRKDKHVEGVSFDTTLAKKSPEVRELKAAQEITETERSEIKEPVREPVTIEMPESSEKKQPEFVINRATAPEPEENEDGSHVYFLNSRYTEANASKPILEFLDLIRTNDVDKNYETPLVQKAREKMREVRSDKELEVSYMTYAQKMLDERRLGFAEGREEEFILTVQRMRQAGLDDKMIALCTGRSIEAIRLVP